MTLKQFEERIGILKQDFKTIENKNTEFLKGLSIYVDDATGVPTSWLYDIINNEFTNLVYAINENAVAEKVKDLIDYYIYEMNFGGEISWEDKKDKYTFDLSNNKSLYEYIKTL